MMKTRKFILLGLIVSTVFAACKRDDDDADDPHDHNEEELITTVEIQLTGDDGSHVMAHWRDIDGPGGTAPEIDTLILDTHNVYTCMIEFLDESGTEVHDITHEIEDEAAEHFVCFSSSNSNLEVSRTDSDGTYEIGIESTWTIMDAATGDLTISLKHQPDVKDGTCIPGETDVEVTFPFVLE